MPNWVYNTVAVKGSKADLINFLKNGISNTTIPVSDDFDTLLANIQNDADNRLRMSNFRPIPKTFQDFDTTNHPNGIGLHYCIAEELKLTEKFKGIDKANDYLYGKLKLANETITNLTLQKSRDIQRVAYNYENEITKHLLKLDTQNTITDSHEVEIIIGQFFDRLIGEVKAYCNATAIQEKEYGCVGWYDYNLKNFGTKWDMQLTDWDSWYVDDNTSVIIFKVETAWSIPDEWLEYLAEKYPNLGFAVRTYEEQPAWNGYFNVREGYFIENHPYEDMYITNDDGDFEWNEELDMGIQDNFEDYVINEL